MCVFECVERLGKRTLLECPLQSEDFGVGCVFMGAFWQEEAGTRSRITVECGTAGNILSQTQGSGF